MFSVDQNSLAFVSQIEEKDPACVVRLSPDSVTFAVERESGVEISEVNLSAKIAHTLTKFRAK